MKPLSRTFAVLCIPLLTLALCWQLGYRYELLHETQQASAMENGATVNMGTGTVMGDPEGQVDLSLFWLTWKQLQARYFSPADLKVTPLVLGAVKGMVAAVGDPYTVFMSPSENTDFHNELSGQLQGIGAELSVKDNVVSVVAPLKNSPAEKSGLKAGDHIVKIDGQSAAGKSLQDVVSLIRGKQGTTVTLTVTRDGTTAPVVLPIIRQQITVPSVETKTLKGTKGAIGVVTLNQFGEDSFAEVRKAVTDFKAQNVSGLVLDLRFNGGGYLDGAVQISSLFLQSGNVVSVKHRDGTLERHPVRGKPLLADVPMVVLINAGSASASEITAGALQDTHRAELIGMKSFGKGTVQEVVDLPGGSSLRVTVAHWLTPAGRDIGKQGIEPDITIDRTQADADANKDPQMDKAVEWLESGKTPGEK